MTAKQMKQAILGWIMVNMYEVDTGPFGEICNGIDIDALIYYIKQTDCEEG
jgi:hypothetical protein